MNCQIVKLALLALMVLTARSGAADSPVDASIARWTERAVAYTEKVADFNERTGLALPLAEVLAKQGKAEQAIALGRKMTDKSERHLLASTIGPYCKVQDAIELAEESTELELKDFALEEIARHYAKTDRPELAEPFLKRISPDRATHSRYAVAYFLERRKKFQQAIDVLDQAKPQTQADRLRIELSRERLKARLRERNATDKGAQPEDKLSSELADAQRDAHNASHPRDDSDQDPFGSSPESKLITESRAWNRVAVIQGKQDRIKESIDALVRAEAAADRTAGLERARLLADIADTYRVLGDRENVRRVAEKNLGLLRSLTAANDASTGERIVERRLELVGQMELLKSIARGELNEAIGLAKKYEKWYQLGAAATIDGAMVSLLERSLDRIDSNAAKAKICVGVIEELLTRSGEALKRANNTR